jgi:hypothetical protein
MRSFSLRILANNEAGSWASWPAKIAAIKAFYASVCDLEITVTQTFLTPKFSLYEGESIYQVDETWYEENVTPLANGADIAMFIVPPSDHTVPTLIGLEANHPLGPWQTTVFTDETSHAYVLENGTDVDQGETLVVYAEHELSHVFYAMLAKTDNTHLYFYAGAPEKVLSEFDFDETLLSDFQQLVATLEQELGLLKARQITPETAAASIKIAVPATQQPATPPQTTFPPKILAWAQIIGKEEGANPELNNPGNLKYSTLTASWGASQGPAAADGGFLAKFATLDAGGAALCNFLVLGCEDGLAAFHPPEARTLAGFTKIYAGNPPQGYIDAIVQAMGGDPNVQISTFLS